jgi:hypothetical protein
VGRLDAGPLKRKPDKRASHKHAQTSEFVNTGEPMDAQAFLAERKERVPAFDLSNPDRRHEPDGFAEIHQPVNVPVSVNQERQSVLTEAQGLVHGDRNLAYGSPRSDYTRTAGMASAMLAHKLKEPLTAADVIQIMICVKLSRQTHRPKRDNCTDGAGYFECLQWVLDEEAGL